MQLAGYSSVVEISSPNKPVMAVTVAARAAEAASHEGVNGGDMIGMDVDVNSGEERGKEEEGRDEGDNNKISFGGNRWPRQETLALLKIRSDMDAVFRDSTLKGPLWEEVSRKLAALGYKRSAKKCKEKFENVYKYNKRTKENRSGKSHGKTYRFFDQLQALENQLTVSNSQPDLATKHTLPPKPNIETTTTFPSPNPTLISPSPPTNVNNNDVPHSLPNNMNVFSTASTSSSTASDEDLEGRHKKKRKFWKDYFRRLTRQVLYKQEEMQMKFLEAIEKREREWVEQQDCWRMQEMARINKEHEILIQERSTAAAKDVAVIAMLQKLCGNENPTQLEGGNSLPQQQPPPPPQPVSQVEPQQQEQPPHPQQPPQTLVASNNFEIKRMNINGGSATSPIVSSSSSSSSSRWPKAEVHALIRLRTCLESKFHENGPKAPLWEELSAGMHRLGYNRNAKRCKEKWENINKYFKKMRQSNKQRREDSKTCPYYHELEALYKVKGKIQNPFGIALHNLKPNEMMEPLMVQPEQQWRPPPQYEQQTLEEREINEKEDEEEEYNDDGVEEEGESGDNIVEDEGTS